MCQAGRLADDLSSQLQAGCPAFFQEADRTFYRASDLLQRAGAAVGVDREGLTRDALALMLQVPTQLCRGLEQTVMCHQTMALMVQGNTASAPIAS